MEKDIALGDVGHVNISLGGGKALVEVKVGKSLLDGSIVLGAGASAQMSADALLDLIFAEIEKKSPPGMVPIEETVKEILKKAAAAVQ